MIWRSRNCKKQSGQSISGHPVIGLAKIYLFCQKITALPSWVSMGVCELKIINFDFFGLTATALSWPTKWLRPLYKWKKNWLDYSVHGIQNDRLGLTHRSFKWPNLTLGRGIQALLSQKHFKGIFRNLVTFAMHKNSIKNRSIGFWLKKYGFCQFL